MFLDVNVFKMSLSWAKNIFTPANINTIVILSEERMVFSAYRWIVFSDIAYLFFSILLPGKFQFSRSHHCHLRYLQGHLVLR